LGGFLLGLVEGFQQFLGVAMVVGDDVGVFEIEVVGAGFDFVGGDLPGDVGFLAPFALGAAPPVAQGLKCSTRMGRVME
jgi:hypothetical protein